MIASAGAATRLANGGELSKIREPLEADWLAVTRITIFAFPPGARKDLAVSAVLDQIHGPA